MRRNSKLGWRCAIVAMAFAATTDAPVAAQTALLVQDLTPQATSNLGPLRKVSSPPWSLGERVIFQAGSAELGYEFWTSDGRPEGTAMLADLCPGTCSSWLTATGLGFALIYQDNDLYATDGTASGLNLLPTILNTTSGCSHDALEHAGAIYFPGTDPDGDCALWRTDGTTAGTGPAVKLLADGGRLHWIRSVGNRLVFAMSTAAGNAGIYRFGPDDTTVVHLGGYHGAAFLGPREINSGLVLGSRCISTAGVATRSSGPATVQSPGRVCCESSPRRCRIRKPWPSRS